MKVGQQVAVFFGPGDEQSATITAVLGSGYSGFKTLNVELVDGSRLEELPHAKDATIGAPHWHEGPPAHPKKRKR